MKTPYPSGPGSLQRSFSSMRNPSAASAASQSTTSLTINDVTDDQTTVTVQLVDPPSPLPGPVAELMRAYILSRQHLPYASSRSSHWLFPGRQPGQPMNPVSLQTHLREIGVPPQRGRASAIRQLVLQAPAPVIAKALGYHDKTATRLITEAGGTWSRYAPGGRNR